MKLTQEIVFTLEDVKGELKLAYSILGRPKLYQDGKLLRKEGAFKLKYFVETDQAGVEEIELKRGFNFVFSVVYRGQTIELEEKLSTLEYVIGALPISLVLFGGVLGAVLGILGATIVYNVMRQEKRLFIQILASLVVAIVVYSIIFSLGLLLTL